MVGGEGHVLLVGAHHDDIVAVVTDAGGYRALLQAAALDIAQTDVMSVLVPFDDGDLQNVIVHVDAVGVAAVGGGDLTADHADDGVGPAVDEVLRTQGGYMERVVGVLHQIGVDLRGGEVLQHAIAVHQLALFEHLLDVEMLKVVDDHEVAQIARSNGAPVIQQEVPRRVVAGGLDGGDGVGAQRDGLLYDVVDVALFQQVVGVLVIGAEHAALHILVAQQGSQRLQIAGGGALADHDELAPLQLGDGIGQIVALVVGVDTRRHIGVEVVALQVGGVAVDLLVMGLTGHDLFHHLRVAVDGAHEIHHLRQPLYAGVVVEGVDGAVVQIGAGLIQRRGRYAGGQHEAHVHRQILRGLQHVLDAVGAHDVGDLVGIGDDRGGAVGQHGLGKLRGTHQRAFQMDVGVHKARQHDLAADIYLLRAVIFAHAYDESLRHGDVAVTQLVGEHVDVGGVFQYQIRRLPSSGHGDDPQLLVELTVDLAGIAFLYRHTGRLLSENNSQMPLVLLILNITTAYKECPPFQL